MTITEQATPAVVVRAAGVLDASNARRLEGELLALTSSGRQIVLDLADLELIASVAMSVLVAAARHSRRMGGRMVLRRPTGLVRDVPRVAALDDWLLSIEDDTA